MKSVKILLATMIAAASSLFLIPATASFAGGGGGTVAGPCGTITSISASAVTLSGGTTSPLQIRGNVANCSIYLQNYWIDFDEPTNTNTTCKVAFSLFNALLLSSGSSQGFSTSTNVGGASASGCAGVHTVRAVLRSRIDGRVLHTTYVNYSVVQK